MSALTDLFTSIANAIREKTGSEGTIQASNFPTAIANIPSGGRKLVILSNNESNYNSVLVFRYNISSELEKLTEEQKEKIIVTIDSPKSGATGAYETSAIILGTGTDSNNHNILLSFSFSPETDNLPYIELWDTTINSRVYQKPLFYQDGCSVMPPPDGNISDFIDWLCNYMGVTYSILTPRNLNNPTITEELIPSTDNTIYTFDVSKMYINCQDTVIEIETGEANNTIIGSAVLQY